jgi:L-fuconolactonase
MTTHRGLPVPVVDSHCHVSPSWYEPVEVLLFQMERNGVDHASLIQMNAQADNRYQQDCVRRFPGKFASVVFVHPDDPSSAGQLEREAGEGASGVRLGPGAPMKLFETAARLKLSVSCGGSGPLFASGEFARVLESFPEIPIVIEHLGGLNRPEQQEDGTRQKVFGLARYPNAHMKIHGLGEFSRRAIPAKEPLPFVEPIPTLLEDAYRAFGPGRIMWGSDYPPVSGREGYANALSLTRDQLRGKDGLGEIFGGTALRVFPVR